MANYMTPPVGDPNRGSQRALKYLPQVEILDDDNTQDLQAAVNAFLLSLNDPLFRYYIRDIQHSSAQLKNNKVSYSCLIRYEIWEDD